MERVSTMAVAPTNKDVNTMKGGEGGGEVWESFNMIKTFLQVTLMILFLLDWDRQQISL